VSHIKGRIWAKGFQEQGAENVLGLKVKMKLEAEENCIMRTGMW
jgi:hypothetical protein